MSTFASARRRRTAHLLAQAALVFLLLLGLNYLATRHAWRLDLTRHARHSLSPETRSYLRDLPAAATLIVTLTDDEADDVIAAAYRDVRSLARDYAESSAALNPQAPVTVKFIDVFRNRAEAQRYGIDQPNAIFVLSGDKRRVIELSRLYAMREREKTAFIGEQEFTAALLDVTRPGRQKIYFVSGRGEMHPDDPDAQRGLTLLTDELRLRNFEIATLDLATATELPPDAPSSLLVLAGPQGPYSAREQELLRRHLSTDAGRILALLPPGIKTGLDQLLYDWGVLADDVLVLDVGPEGRADAGDLILYPAASGHPIVSFLSLNQIPLRFGLARSVRADPGRSLDPGLAVLPLLASSATAWGERDYLRRGPPTRDPTDLIPEPRLALGTASERMAPAGALPFSVRGGRLVAIGGADWMGNARLASAGNLSLALSSINWLVDRDAQLSLPPRPIERFQLSLSTSRLGQLRLVLLLGLPSLTALLGLLVYWQRRR